MRARLGRVQRVYVTLEHYRVAGESILLNSSSYRSPPCRSFVLALHARLFVPPTRPSRMASNKSSSPSGSDRRPRPRPRPDMSSDGKQKQAKSPSKKNRKRLRLTQEETEMRDGCVAEYERERAERLARKRIKTEPVDESVQARSAIDEPIASVPPGEPRHATPDGETPAASPVDLDVITATSNSHDEMRTDACFTVLAVGSDSQLMLEAALGHVVSQALMFGTQDPDMPAGFDFIHLTRDRLCARGRIDPQCLDSACRTAKRRMGEIFAQWAAHISGGVAPVCRGPPAAASASSSRPAGPNARPGRAGERSIFHHHFNQPYQLFLHAANRAKRDACPALGNRTPAWKAHLHVVQRTWDGLDRVLFHEWLRLHKELVDARDAGLAAERPAALLRSQRLTRVLELFTKVGGNRTPRRRRPSVKPSPHHSDRS